MKKAFVQNKYNAGDVVSAKSDPSIKLVVRRYIDKIYYCRVQNNPDEEKAFFERELTEDPELAADNKKARTLNEQNRSS